MPEPAAEESVEKESAVFALPPESDNAADRAIVEKQKAEVAEFVKQLSGDEIKSGAWFAKLLTFSVITYAEKADWSYFQDKYKGVPADAIVDQRIKMASRYAAIEGGLSAGAYTGAVAATIGSLGGASPLTVPAAVATMMVDVVYVTQLQLRLTHDIAVLYRVPVDMSDPDDLWKLIRVSFTIRGGEIAREGILRVVPALVRPLVKRFYSKAVLQAAKGLPVVGKYLLQRNVIKIGIPLVGVPLSVVVNNYTTQIAGKHAQAVFRNEARIIELANRLSDETRHPRLALWVAWLVIDADPGFSNDQALLFRLLVANAEKQHDVIDEGLAALIELDVERVLSWLDVEDDDLTDVVNLASGVANVDGPPSKKQREMLKVIARRCERTSK